MKNLLLLRHAKSSWNDSSLPDHQRPLNERGKRDAPRAGEQLVARQIRPQLVLSSSAKRAAKTAKKAIEASGYETELRLLDELYLATPDAYLAQLRKLPDSLSCILVVGHNPGMEELLLGLTGLHQAFPTAGLASLDIATERWRDLQLDHTAQLRWQWRPDEE
ncbi:MAG: histidine phosphatase family protein [Pirellulaceae bacterium]